MPVCLESPLFIFRPLPFFFLNFFISVVFKEFNEAENTVMWGKESVQEEKKGLNRLPPV